MKKTLIIILLLIAVLGLVAWLLTLDKTSSVDNLSSVVTKEEKIQVLEDLSKSSENIPTKSEQEKILDDLSSSGDNIETTPSLEEKMRILESLK